MIRNKEKYKVTINYKNLTNTSFDVKAQLNKLGKFYSKAIKKGKTLTIYSLKQIVIVNTKEINDIQIEELGWK